MVITDENNPTLIKPTNFEGKLILVFATKPHFGRFDNEHGCKTPRYDMGFSFLNDKDEEVRDG